MAAVGALVRRRRIELGQSQTDLAETLGSTRQWVSRLEQGKRDVSTARLFAVLEALNLHADIRRPERVRSLTVPGMQSMIPEATLRAIQQATANAIGSGAEGEPA